MSRLLSSIMLLTAFAACDSIPGHAGDRATPSAPSAAEVREHYGSSGAIEVEMSGNLARVIVDIDPGRYRTGGNTWLKGIHYLYLFSDGTKSAFDAHEGLGAVRVAIRHPNGDIIGEALLRRDRLNDLTWQRALAVAGRARLEATERPGRMWDLVRWGEDHTEFEYNPVYISQS